jgi:hypothetical protein
VTGVTNAEVILMNEREKKAYFKLLERIALAVEHIARCKDNE